MITLDYAAIEGDAFYDHSTKTYHYPGSLAVLTASIDPDPGYGVCDASLRRDIEHLAVCFEDCGASHKKALSYHQVIPLDLPRLVAQWNLPNSKHSKPTATFSVAVHSPFATTSRDEPELEIALQKLWRAAQGEIANCIWSVINPANTFALFDTIPIRLHPSAVRLLRACGVENYPAWVKVHPLGKRAQPV